MTLMQFTRFDLYSFHGRLLGSATTQPEAERLLGRLNAYCVVGITEDGSHEVVAEREGAA